MISQFSLDWISRNWYFLDTANNFIFVCTNEMKFCKTIVPSTKNNQVKLKTFALDPTAGFLFVTKHNPTNREGSAIMRYDLDGSNMLSLLQEKIFFPNDISLDIAMKKIYFLDQYFDFIQICDYNGKDRQFLQKLPFMKMHRVAIFENRFFAAVHNNNSIIQIREGFTTFKRAATESLGSQPKLFKLFHQQIQPESPKKEICAVTNKCNHLCVPKPVTANETPRPSPTVEECLCAEGFKLDNGKCTIKKAKRFLMFVQDFPKMLRSADTDYTDDQAFAPIVGLKTNVAFDVDLNNQTIYFTSSVLSLNSSEANAIEFRSLNGSSRGMLTGIFGAIEAMSFDWVGKNLFISSKLPRPRISAIKLQTDSKGDTIMKTLISKNLTGPCSLALDPEKGKQEALNH